MSSKDIEIFKLEDLDKLRSAPKLNKNQSEKLFNELRSIINKSDWLTIGIMSPSLEIGIKIIRRIEEKFECNKMKCVTLPSSEGPVFLKANQKTGDIHIRVESGLGEGILLGCHYHNDEQNVDVLGPLPLNFFNLA